MGREPLFSIPSPHPQDCPYRLESVCQLPPPVPALGCCQFVPFSANPSLLLLLWGERLLSGSPRPGSGWAGRPRSTGGSAGGRPTTATSSTTAVATHARRGVTGSWHVVGVDGWGLGGQWLPLGLGHGRDEGGLHEPLEVLAGCDRGDRGHEGTGHFPKTGALLRGGGGGWTAEGVHRRQILRLGGG